MSGESEMLILAFVNCVIGRIISPVVLGQNTRGQKKEVMI